MAALGGKERGAVTSVALAGNSSLIRPAADLECLTDGIPAAIVAELNADSDRGVLIRMRHLARKKRMRQPDITEEEMADYLALAENCKNFEEWRKARQGILESHPSGSTIAWALGTLAIVGVLTATLIATIAITVSSL
jgi:hypothetical protein